MFRQPALQGYSISTTLVLVVVTRLSARRGALGTLHKIYRGAQTTRIIFIHLRRWEDDTNLRNLGERSGWFNTGALLPLLLWAIDVELCFARRL